jgi:hypothetical protein
MLHKLKEIINYKYDQQLNRRLLPKWIGFERKVLFIDLWLILIYSETKVLLAGGYEHDSLTRMGRFHHKPI